jgi:hypothetical protein
MDLWFMSQLNSSRVVASTTPTPADGFWFLSETSIDMGGTQPDNSPNIDF